MMRVFAPWVGLDACRVHWGAAPAQVHLQFIVWAQETIFVNWLSILLLLLSLLLVQKQALLHLILV